MAIFFLNACDSSRIYEENREHEDRVWDKNDISKFIFVIPETGPTYNVYFNLRNTMNYPHNNIYISYQLKDSLGRTLQNELKNFLLFDPKLGTPYGKSGLGDIFDHQFALLEKFSFESAGTKTMEIQQFMRYDSLPEIVSIGVRVELAK